MYKTTGEVWDPEWLLILINSGHNVAVVNAQNHRWGLGPIETYNSAANHAVLHAQNDSWSLGSIETINSGHNAAFLHAKTTDKGWGP